MRGEGLLSFCKGCRNGEGRCNGRSEQGKEALSVCAQGLCKDAKPTKHTQTLTLRKAREIVRFWEGWWSNNPSGSRPNFFGRQHLTFDKGGKCGGAKQGIVQKISLMVGMGSNHHHSWLGLTVQQNLTLLNVRG